MAKAKILIALIFISAINFFIFPVSSYEKDFLKGNIKDKINVVQQSSKSGDYSIAVKSLEFSLSAHESIGDDADISSLVKTSIDCINIKALPSDKKENVSLMLGKAFKSFESDTVRMSILNVFNSYLTESNLSILNAYIADLAQKASDNPSSVPMNNVILKALSVLKNHGDKTSFNILFIADLMGVWPKYSSVLEDSFVPLADKCENEILKIVDSSGTAERIKILNIIRDNQQIPRKTKGFVAEKILSDVIINVRDNKGNFSSDDEISLYVSSLDVLAENEWTRSAKTIAGSFTYAKTAYEKRKLPQELFVRVISDIAEVASPDTGKVLSSYLDYLNKGMEAGKVPVKDVVLSTIKALGGLGDKSAFDYLLYVTYLDYPEEVTTAARLAIAQLKW